VVWVIGFNQKDELLMMNTAALFNQPRLQLALRYSGVIGGVLLLIGYVAHRAVNMAFDSVVDREITLVALTVEDKLQAALAAHGQLVPHPDQAVGGLCGLDQPCQPAQPNAVLSQLLENEYHLQLLNLQGQPIGAIGEPPAQFMANPKLLLSTTITDPQGRSYHAHLIAIQTAQGLDWGYLQVGRSTRQLDVYMSNLHWVIGLGIPIATLLIGATSWWFAGLAMRPLYRSYEQMQQFTANAAHELRTPIAAIKTMLEVAPLEAPADQQQTLRAIQRQNDRLGQLAQDLLLLARLDGTIAAKRGATIVLNDLVQDLEEELAPLALAAQVKLSTEMAASPLTIQGQSDQIYRLVSNLMINAINYTAANGTIVVRLQRKQNQAMIMIEDNGSGIAAADLPHLFERFYRVNHDRARQSGGVGLGLAIARTIALAHGGQIQVQSQLGEGSRFTVRLPLIPNQLMIATHQAP
jgi:signal transduction histidine kinase